MSEPYQAVLYRKGKSERLEAYRACMASKLKDKEFKTREERWANFCVSAKLCSGKAKDMKEAKKMCLEAHPEWEKIISAMEEKEKSL